MQSIFDFVNGRRRLETKEGQQPLAAGTGKETDFSLEP